MRLFEITVSSRSNGNWNSTAPTLTLPYDLELTAPNGAKAMHLAGTKVSFRVLNQRAGTGFKIRLFRTVFSAVLSFDSKQECIDAGFII